MTSLDGLLGAILGAPALPGARCRGRHRLFDELAPTEATATAGQRHAQAVLLCRSCPALTRCQTWLAGLPPRKRPYGVVAGEIRTRKTQTPHRK